MRSLYALPLLTGLLASAPAFAQGLPHADWARDAQTGEPVPFSDVAPPAYEPSAESARGADELVVLDHWAEGSTKVARVDGDEVLYQNGALLISSRLGGDFLNLAPLDTLALPGQPGDIALTEGYAYVALRKGRGFVVVDRTDPADIQQVAWVNDGREGVSVTVNGDALYRGLGTAGIAVYDISTPTAPAFVRAFDTPGSANGFAVDGDLLFVADGNNANAPDARLYDVSDPLEPSALGAIEAGGFATGVALDGDLAYVVGGAGLIIADVTDASAPVVLTTLSMGDETTYEVDLSVSGDTAYVSGLAGVFAVDVSDPAAPVILGQNAEVQQVLAGAFAPDFDALVVSDRFAGIRLIGTAEPDVLPELLRIPNGGFSARGTFVSGPVPESPALLYVTDLAGALRVFEVADGTDGGASLQQIGYAAVPANTQEVEVRGDRAYVTDADFGGTGLTILDVSDPTSPAVLGGYMSPNQAFGLDVIGTTVYLCNGFSGLVVLDASDPANIAELGNFPFGANATDVVVDAENEVAYVVSFGGGMRSLDVSDPANITELDAEAWGFLNAVAFEPSFGFAPERAYVADGQQGLRIVDVEDPADLATLVTAPTLSQARDVAAGNTLFGDAGGPTAYVADDFYGIRVFENGSLLAANESADRGFGVATPLVLEEPFPFTEQVALMSGETGIYLFEAPFFVATEGDAEGNALSLSASPNPLRSATRMAFSLPGAAPVRLDAFDVLGRRVAVLHDGPLAAGNHERQFDASALPAGVYVLRLQTDAGVATTRVTVVR